MKHNRVIIIVAIALVVIALIATGIWWGTNSFSSKPSSQLVTSGFIESRDTSVAFEVGGRITALNAQEGDTVKVGATLAKLDDSLLAAQKQQAEAAVAQAQASVDQATASYNQAIVARDGAKQILADAIDIQTHPLTLNGAVITAKGQVEIAQTNLSLATDSLRKITYPYTYETVYIDAPRANGFISDAIISITKATTAMDTKEYSEALVQLRQALDSLSKSQDQLYRVGSGTDPFWSQYLSMDQFWTLRAAEFQVQQAQSVVNTATSMLQNALDIKNNPQQLIVAADTARANYNNADAAVNAATSAINLAQKQVRQAQASMDVINAQLSKMTIFAPVSGVVASSNARVGEIAVPGSAIYTIADINVVTLDVYVPESKIGEVKIGQKATVTVDSYPGQSFTGEVSYISPRAEYTPQNVQTQGQHLETLAFTVKISLPNPDYKLKEGVAADANISVGPQK